MLRNHFAVALSFALAVSSLGVGRAEAQVFVGGPGFVGAGYGLGVNAPYSYGYGFGSPWSAGYGYTTSTFYGAPTVGYMGVGYYGGGYGYYPYGYYGGPWVRGFALPPVVVPAETMFGPQAVQRFLGVEQSLATPAGYNLPVVNGAAAPSGFGVNAAGVRVPKAQHPPSNQAARERAKRQLEIGDDWFRKHAYGNAAQAYRDAIRAAPDVADAYFHQAAVSIAQGRYDAAVESIKTGLKVSTTYIDGGFKYAALYGDRNKQAEHLELLAQAATDAPTSDLFYLMGVILFFDEQPRRAGPFFAKARELVVGDTWHIDVFLELLKRMDAAAAEEAVKKAAAAGAAVGAPPEARPPKLPAPGADGKEI